MFKQWLFKYWGSSISHVDKNVIRYTIFSLFIGWWTFGLFFCGFEIVNSTALNREYWYLFETVVSFTLNAYLEVELLDHMVVLFLFFWGISKYLFSWWLCRFAFPTTLVVKWLRICLPMQGGTDLIPGLGGIQGFLFLRILTSVYLLSFDDGHPDSCEVLSPCDFDLHSLYDWSSWAPSLCLGAICASSLERC